MSARTWTMKKTAVAALVAVFGCAPLVFVLARGIAPPLRTQPAPREATTVFAPTSPQEDVAEETPEWVDARSARADGPALAEAPVDTGQVGATERGDLYDLLAQGATTAGAQGPGGLGPVDGARGRARRAPAPTSASHASSPRSAPPATTARAGLGSLGYGGGAPPPPRAALPSSGVLASTFVGGHGAASRLEDLMDRGVMVDGERVQLGAFDALGHLPYAVPAHDAVALYAELERATLREDGEHVHMQIALVAREGERPARPRMDVRLVLDRSGSMIGEKWTSAIAAAHALVDHLRPEDTFGLVSYAEAASLDLAPARLGNRRAAHAAIDHLVAGGGTNIGDALDVVSQNAPHRRAPNDVLLVMLVSDGLASVGTADASTLASQARTMFEQAGIVTTTLGVGTDFDENTMLSIAREGSGSYEFVRRSADIAPILTQELDERALAVAQDLRLRIELSPGVTLARVYGSRVLDDAEAARVRATEVAVDDRIAHELGIPSDRQVDDQTGLRMHIPSFRRGDQHVVLLDLVVPPGTGDTDIAHVSLDYKDLAQVANAHAVVRVHGERTSDLEVADQSVRRPVKRTVLAFQAAETLREASEALAVGDAARADALLEERVTLLRAAAQFWHDDSMQRDAHLLASYQRAIGGAWHDWDESSRHTLVLAMGYYGDQRME